MPDDASEAFLLWASAAHSNDWDRVLKSRLTLASYLAAGMLKAFKSYHVLAQEKQSQQMALMMQAMMRG